jgi:hypothetical protein
MAEFENADQELSAADLPLSSRPGPKHASKSKPWSKVGSSSSISQGSTRHTAAHAQQQPAGRASASSRLQVNLAAEMLSSAAAAGAR